MVRHSNSPMTGFCWAGVRVTVDLERAAERCLTIADDFIELDERDRSGPGDEQWLADIVEGARRGAVQALDEYDYQVGPLRLVLVRHRIHPVDSGYMAVRAGTHRAVREAIAKLGPAMVRDWVTFAPGGPRVRLTSPEDTVEPDRSALVTVEAECAAERAVLVADGFVTVSRADRDRVSPAAAAELASYAVQAAHSALNTYEDRVGLVRLTLAHHPWREDSSHEYGLRDAVWKAVRMAVEQLEFALAETRAG